LCHLQSSGSSSDAEEGAEADEEVRSVSKIEMLEKQLEELRKLIELQNTLAALNSMPSIPQSNEAPQSSFETDTADTTPAAPASASVASPAPRPAAQPYRTAAAPRVQQAPVAATPQRPSMVAIMSAAKEVQLRRTASDLQAQGQAQGKSKDRRVSGRHAVASQSQPQGLEAMLRAAMDKKFAHMRHVEASSPMSGSSMDSNSDFGSPSTTSPGSTRRGAGAGAGAGNKGRQQSAMAVRAARRASRGVGSLQPLMEEASTAAPQRPASLASEAEANGPVSSIGSNGLAAINSALMRKLSAVANGGPAPGPMGPAAAITGSEHDVTSTSAAAAPPQTQARSRSSSMSKPSGSKLKKSVSFGANMINVLASDNDEEERGQAQLSSNTSANAVSSSAVSSMPRPPMALLSAIKSIKPVDGDENAAPAPALVLRKAAAAPAPAPAAATTAAPKGGNMLSAIQGFDRSKLKKAAAEQENIAPAAASGKPSGAGFTSPSKGAGAKGAKGGPGAGGLVSPVPGIGGMGGFHPGEIRNGLRKTGAKLA
jgi:hypothetical protein